MYIEFKDRVWIAETFWKIDELTICLKNEIGKTMSMFMEDVQNNAIEYIFVLLSNCLLMYISIWNLDPSLINLQRVRQVPFVYLYMSHFTQVGRRIKNTQIKVCARNIMMQVRIYWWVNSWLFRQIWLWSRYQIDRRIGSILYRHSFAKFQIMSVHFWWHYSKQRTSRFYISFFCFPH